ncbi:MAG: GNAT family N-acetyltransferase [Polyangiaceae bacterium]
MQFSTMKAADVPVLSEMLSTAFAFPAENAPLWLRTAKHSNVRVVREGRRVLACLIVIPMGHFFGGRSVPTTGIAGVAVSLDARGKGVARWLMEQTLRESARKKVPLSTLFPSTQTLYRKVGYERAGKLCEVELATAHFRAPRSDLTSRALTKRDEPAVERLYTETARDRNGFLDRGPYMWSRVRKPRGKPTYGVGFFTKAGELDAYLHFFNGRSDDSLFYTIVVKDAAARDARGYDAIISFLGDLRSCGRTVELRGSPSDPLLMRIAEPHYEERSIEDWMLRVVDARRALDARGYPRFMRASVTLALRDELFPSNARRLRLDVAEGRGAVSEVKPTKDALHLDVRALAPLYTGYLSATRLAALGELEGSARAIEAADAIFSGPMPSMNEMF